ncbi:MAG TPA: Xaa-Pro peptidase family protein [Actinomycetota bacterium]|nr:Xaa-Pro peptidase family protein [Actinomycetota bacterium]
MAFEYLARLDRARERTSEAGLDGLVLAVGPDLLYLAGYDAPALERLTTLVVRPGDPVLVVPELEEPRARVAVGETLEVVTWSDGQDPYEVVARLIPPDAGGIGVSEQLWAAHLLALQGVLPEARFVPASNVLAPLRARKEQGEIDLLRRAARAADEAFNRIVRETLAGRTEHDVARLLGEHLEDAGHDAVAFTIVGSGPNGASPHHEPGDRGIRAGDALVMDFGGQVQGYCSDITRTVSVGPASEELAEVHDIVRLAQEEAFKTAGPGVPAEEVDRAARSVIEEAGYGDVFVHRTGHGIGLELHETPYIVAGNREPLEVGNCFSIEPGIYLDGRFGVRIEDIVAITEEGAVRLNHATRDLVVVA